MLFRPNLDTTLVISGAHYTFLEHPSAKRMVYGQAGKRATVYKIQDQENNFHAFKVFTQKYRSEDIETSAKLLGAYHNVPGLEVCKRHVLTTSSQTDLVKQYPDLEYAVLMPWVQGNTWFDILKGRLPFTKNESLFIANSFISMMANIEQQGLAHCDLSGPNLLIDFKYRRVALVDVEEMYGPSFIKPSILPSGTSGYGHKSTEKGIWGADADRFSGSVLIAEILGKCAPQFQTEMANEAESFFEKEEIQTNSPRYQTLSQILLHTYGKKVQALFEQAWFSTTLDACPRFDEWNQVIEISQVKGNSATVPASGVPRLYNTNMFANEQPVQVPNETPRATPTVQAPPVLSEGPVSAWRSLKPERNMDPTEYEPANQIPAAPHMGREYFSSQSTTLHTAPTSTNSAQAASVIPPATAKLPFNVIGGFAIVGIIAVVALLVFGSSVENLKNIAQNMSFAAFYGLGSTSLALLLGLLQAWVFKGRLRIAKRTMYVLITTLGGLVGGSVVGIITTIILADGNSYLMGFVAGAIIGALGGCVASLGQNVFLGNASASGKWFLFNLLTWTVIWSLGWSIAAWMPGIVGTAIGAGTILLLSGVSLQMLLKYSPEIEF